MHLLQKWLLQGIKDEASVVKVRKCDTPDSTLETDPGLFQGIGVHIYNLTQGNVDTAFFYP